MRSKQVGAEGGVHAEMLREVDRLAVTAMAGQALVGKWRDTLAGSDPLLYDELKFFTDVARVAKAEVLADAVARLRRL